MSKPSHEARFSRYLRTRERGKWTAVFHELHPQPWYVPTAVWQSLHAAGVTVPPAAKIELRQRGLLVTESTADDTALAAAQADLDRRLDRAEVLYLVLAQGCNFSCAYCPIPELSRETGNVLMSPHTVRAAVDLWATHIRDDAATDAEYCAILYGGEPLLNTPALTSAVEYIEGLQRTGDLPPEPNLTIMVCTNGVLLDQPMARYFREYKVSVAIGCDGPAEQHDAIRRDIHGNATYDQVAAAISTLVDAGVTTFASTSITPHNVAELGNFSAFFEDLGVSKFGFNFLRGKLLFRLIRRDRLQEYYERATDGVLANFDNAGGQHLEYQIERKHLAFLERHYFPTDCSAYGNQLVVEPTGQIGNCPFIRGTMGNVHDVSPNFRIRTQPVVQKWRARLPLNNPVCAPCDAKSICGAGCAWNAQELKGDPLALDDGMCLLTRKIFDRLIWADHHDEATL